MYQKGPKSRVRQPGCLSIEGEGADPSRIMAYAEADSEEDMQNVIFYPTMFFQSKMAPKNAKNYKGVFFFKQR